MKPQRKWIWGAACVAAITLSGCVLPPPPHGGPGPGHPHDRYDRDGRPGDGYRGGPPPGPPPGHSDGRRW